jgi:hypothetical protein
MARPRRWSDEARTARVAADTSLRMTDRFALDEHHRLPDSYAWI